jgi:hypothetical protein
MRDDYDDPIRYVSDQILCEPHGVVGDRGIREPAYPDDNPKTIYGVKKTPLHLIPPPAKVALARAMECGAKKYGPFNWREKRVSCSVYKAAAERHLDAFWDGEDLDPESKAHHLGHAMACCAIILDALASGMLNDDRPLPLVGQSEHPSTIKLTTKCHDEVDSHLTGSAIAATQEKRGV